MHRISALVLVLGAAACGGKSSPPPASPTGGSGSSSGGDTSGAELPATDCTPATQPQGAPHASCMLTLPQGQYCADFTSNGDDAGLCGLMKGVYADTPCKTDGVVARCLVQCGKPIEAINTYYFGTADQWQQACATTKGTFLTAAP
ncbi:MAG TPA: hypothetical protein VHE35_30400 [Kofleriaceae bacterium]|nr:hypothetical protein [Kofleriaceae bacterium]